MAKYEITWCEIKKTGETNGRPWKITSMTLKDEVGNVTDKVDTFDPVTPGITIEGVIEMKGQYKNFKSTPTTSKTGSNGAYKSQQIEKAQDRKSSDIERFQGKKEEAIKMAGAQRDAVLIVIELMKNTAMPFSEEAIGVKIVEWRNWFLSDDFEQHPPF